MCACIDAGVYVGPAGGAYVSDPDGVYVEDPRGKCVRATGPSKKAKKIRQPKLMSCHNLTLTNRLKL